ncbi:MAG TPA: hypothetical protein VHQ03_09540 [Candidatus Dormibacteraeota bacterium]|nr:hypothetical protein [Candidatus Dormibacteraeota bacterium]
MGYAPTVEVLSPKYPDGQHYILREYLRTLFAAAPFGGQAWMDCTKAFLGIRAIPVLGSNFTTLAPASFFLRLYASREPDFGTDREDRWGEVDFRRTLTELGEQRLQMLIASDETRSWVIYLSEDLKTILAFHGRPKPGPRFAPEDDERDISKGEVVRDVLPGEPAKVEKLDLTDMRLARVEVRDARGQRYELTFGGCNRIQHPAPGNELVAQVVEVRGQSGRSWFVFRPAGPNGRVLAIQAESVAVRLL